MVIVECYLAALRYKLVQSIGRTGGTDCARAAIEFRPLSLFINVNSNIVNKLITNDETRDDKNNRKLQEKMSRKVLVNTERNVLMLPGHPIILLKSNLYQYGDRNGKKVYWNSIK